MTCSICGATGKTTRGFCNAHYLRWWRTGDPLSGGPLRADLQQLKADTIKAVAAMASTGECIDWLWGTDQDGYALVKSGGRNRRVTHIVLELTGQARPPAPSNVALHSCDRPICIAPWHLRWGTTGDNMRDKVERGRTAHGEAHGRTTLTEQQVLEIRLRTGSSKRALAREYGVARATISDIQTRRTWKYLP